MLGDAVAGRVDGDLAVLTADPVLLALAHHSVLKLVCHRAENAGDASAETHHKRSIQQPNSNRLFTLVTLSYI